MKRLFVVILSVILSFSLVACQEKTETVESTGQELLETVEDMEVFTDVTAENESETERLTESSIFSVTEIESYPFEAEPSQFALINLCPCVVVDGDTYLYEDGSWAQIQLDRKMAKIYSGEIFCGLTADGEIAVGPTEWEWGNYENYSLTTAGALYNTEMMMKLTAGEKIEQLSTDILREHMIALFENGKTKLFIFGKSYDIAESLVVEEVSGNYLRTDSGDVYVLKYTYWETKDSLSVNLRKVSSDKIISISACPTANRCVGIKSDGSVEAWLGIAGNLVSDFQNIDMVSMGFDYCVAAGKDGKAYFSAYDSELEEAIGSYLNAMERKVICVTCEDDRIAIMFDDYSICMIDFGDWLLRGNEEERICTVSASIN